MASINIIKSLDWPHKGLALIIEPGSCKGCVLRSLMEIFDPALKAVLTLTAALLIKTICELRDTK